MNHSVHPTLWDLVDDNTVDYVRFYSAFEANVIFNDGSDMPLVFKHNKWVICESPSNTNYGD